MGQLRLNDRCYTGAAGGGGGCFIDTSNVIKAATAIPANTDVTYAATQNCIVVFTLISASNNSAKAELGGVKVYEQYNSSAIWQATNLIAVKGGQSITFRQSYTGGDGNYVVYGITP